MKDFTVHTDPTAKTSEGTFFLNQKQVRPFMRDVVGKLATEVVENGMPVAVAVDTIARKAPDLQVYSLALLSFHSLMHRIEGQKLWQSVLEDFETVTE